MFRLRRGMPQCVGMDIRIASIKGGTPTCANRRVVNDNDNKVALQVLAKFIQNGPISTLGAAVLLLVVRAGIVSTATRCRPRTPRGFKRIVLPPTVQNMARRPAQMSWRPMPARASGPRSVRASVARHWERPPRSVVTLTPMTTMIAGAVRIRGSRPTRKLLRGQV